MQDITLKSNSYMFSYLCQLQISISSLFFYILENFVADVFLSSQQGPKLYLFYFYSAIAHRLEEKYHLPNRPARFSLPSDQQKLKVYLFLIIYSLPFYFIFFLCRQKKCYSKLTQTLDYWEFPIKITQNYPNWQFKYPLPELSADWLSLIRHSLLYYLLKNLQWTFNQIQTHWIVVHSHAMKQAYSKIMLSHRQDFDLKLLILIKTIALFIGKSIYSILVDMQLQNDIYQLIVHNLLGIAVQTYAYRSLLKIYKGSQHVKNTRYSEDSDFSFDFSGSLETKSKNLQMGIRRHAKRQTLETLVEVTQLHSNIQEMKSIIKENLYVKPNIRPRTPKYNIHQLRQIENESSNERTPNLRQTFDQKQHNKDFNKRKQNLLSNQLSNAFEFSSSLKLKDVKTFPIQRSKARLEPIGKPFYAKVKNTNESKLEPKVEVTKQNAQRKNGSKNWTQIVSTMKSQLYTGKHKIQNKKPRGAYNYDNDMNFTKLQSKKLSTSTHQDSINILGSIAEGIKFRKLDLLNNQNIKIMQQGGLDSADEETIPLITKNYSLYLLKQQNPFSRSDVDYSKKETKLQYRNSVLDKSIK